VASVERPPWRAGERADGARSPRDSAVRSATRGPRLRSPRGRNGPW
jgi:hypothetical protein